MSARSARTRPGCPAIQITCVIPQRDSAHFRSLLSPLGIREMTLQSARRTLLRERRMRSRGVPPLSEELVEIARFYVPPAGEGRAVSVLADGFGFGEPGRGSLVSRRMTLLGVTPSSACGRPPGRTTRDRTRVSRDLAGLCCIVPRGEGTAVARVALEAGLCAPVVTFGRGVGSRGRLGLIRVTIPVEKEIVTLFLSRHDVDEAFRLMSEVMRLDRPGAGFCYWFPLESGILDTRIWVGRQPHVASMEQVIAALDGVTGDTVWRRKTERTSPVAGHPFPLSSYTIHGTEGDTEPIVRSAMGAGAGGATLSRLRRERLDGASGALAACENSDLIVAESALPAIQEAVGKAGLLDQAGFVEIAGVGGASGYRPPATRHGRPGPQGQARRLT